MSLYSKVLKLCLNQQKMMYEFQEDLSLLK